MAFSYRNDPSEVLEKDNRDEVKLAQFNARIESYKKLFKGNTGSVLGKDDAVLIKRETRGKGDAKFWEMIHMK